MTNININFFDLELHICDCCNHVFKASEMLDGLCSTCHSIIHAELDGNTCELCDDNPEWKDGLCSDCWVTEQMSNGCRPGYSDTFDEFDEVEVDQCGFCNAELPAENFTDGLCSHCIEDGVKSYEHETDDDGWNNCHTPVVCIFKHQTPVMGLTLTNYRSVFVWNPRG